MANLSDDKPKFLYMASKTFTPSAPIDDYALFAGRQDQINRVLSAVNQKGQHAILFGERGVGKTSLANVMHALLITHSPETATVKINCNSATTHSTIWHEVFRELQIEEKSRKEVRKLDTYLKQSPSPEDIRLLLSSLPHTTLIIIDELDRIEDPNTSKQLSDTIKTLSDHAVDSTLILVGIADSVAGLIKEHSSIERALVQVRMPRMSQDELEEIVEKGLGSIPPMKIERTAKRRIAKLSQGLPHYTHLLALHSCQSAIHRGEILIKNADVDIAIGQALSHAQQSLIQACHRATQSTKTKTLYFDVLLSCAMARTDELGYFSSSEVRDGMRLVTGKNYEIPAFSQHLKEFCEESRGPVLERIGRERNFRYRFKNPALQPLIVMDGLHQGKIMEDKS